MANRNDYDYFDLDNFDDSFDSRSYRRRQQQRMQGTYNRRPAYNVRPRKRRNKRRTRNRIIIVSGAILLLIFFIVLLSTMFRGCSNLGANNPSNSVSTDTKDKQNSALVPTEPPIKDDLSPAYFITPQIKDDNTDGAMYSGIYVWNNVAFELFGSSEQKATNYANTINGFADKLMGIKVYDMVIPNHTEMELPQRLKDSSAPSSSQAENIKSIYSKLSGSVTPINAYNYLASHNNEYIYFDSDHHWTGLGAYYAYSAFADSTKQPVLKLENCTEQKIEGFTGSFATNISGLNTDTVSYWEFPYSVQMDITDKDGIVNTYEGPYYQHATGGSLTYGVFLMGDNPLTVLKSSSENGTGKKIAVVKESYGNAFVPYLTYNYEEVHVIDFRHFGQNLKSYCQLNEIDEVLFINGIMSANTQIQLDSMSSLFN